MDDDPQRALSIKNLENLKLRQRIQELEKEAVKNKNKHSGELFTLSNENQTLQRQHDIEIRSKIRQLNQNNKYLMEELVDARKSQCRAEEEIVGVSEKSLQLKIDLKSAQEDYEKCRLKIADMKLETNRKDQKFQELLENFNQCKHQNVKLQEEIEKLSNHCKNAKADIRKKDSQILQLTNCLEESNKHSLEQEILEKTIQTLQAEKSALKSEIQETDSNRNNMAKILLKNKEFSSENKKLKTANEKLLNEKSTLENQLILNKEHTEKIEEALKSAQLEISQLNDKTLKLDMELQDSNMALMNKTELTNRKFELEKINHLLKKKCENQEAEIEKYNQNISSLNSEISTLKQNIHGLEAGNVKKLKIIAKLKTGNDFSMCNT